MLKFRKFVPKFFSIFVCLIVVLGSVNCLSVRFDGVASAQSSSLSKTSIGVGEEIQKGIVVNGNNYVVLSSNGSYQDTDVAIESVDSTWKTVTETLGVTSGYAVNDFYVYQFGSVLPDTIVICGHFMNCSGFILEFNVVNSSFVASCSISSDAYVTQVLYEQSIGMFALTATGSWLNDIILCAPADLCNPSNWQVHDFGNFDSNLPFGSEHMITSEVSSGNSKYIYLLCWAEASGGGLWRYNELSGVFSEVYTSGNGSYLPTLPYDRCYISTDSYNVYFSLASNNGTYFNYYVYNDGSNVRLLLSLPILGQGIYGGEHHGNIFPFNGAYLMIGDLYDDDPDGYWAICSNTGVLIRSFAGVTAHFSDNDYIGDGSGNVVLGGEDDSSPDAQITLISGAAYSFSVSFTVIGGGQIQFADGYLHSGIVYNNTEYVRILENDSSLSALAVPDPGYKFSHFEVSNDAVKNDFTQNPVVATISISFTLTAYFVPIELTDLHLNSSRTF